MAGKRKAPTKPTPKKLAEPKWLAKFLAALAEDPTVFAACAKANVHKSTVYDRRKTHPEFAALMDAVRDDANENANERLIQSALDRAVNGVVVKTEYNDSGDIVYQEKKYETALLIFLMKTRIPDPYNRAPGDTGKGAGNDLRDLAQRLIEAANEMDASLSPPPDEAKK